MSPRAAWRLEALGFGQVYEYTAGKSDWLANGLPREGAARSVPYAGEVVHRDVATCLADERVGEVGPRIERSAHSFALVLNEADILLGRLTGDAVAQQPDAAAGDVMDPGPVTIRPNQPAAALGESMAEHGRHTMIVTSPQGRFLGVLRRDDALAAGEHGASG